MLWTLAPSSVNADRREALLLSVLRDNWMRATAKSLQSVDGLRRLASEPQDERGRFVLTAADEREIAALRLEKGEDVC